MELYVTKEQLLEALTTVLYQDSPGVWYNSYMENCNLAKRLSPGVIEAMEKYSATA
jgi:hypothetical protein